MLEDIKGCLFCAELVERVRVWLSPIFLLLFECLVRNMRGRLHVAIYLPPLNRRLGFNIDLQALFMGRLGLKRILIYTHVIEVWKRLSMKPLLRLAKDDLVFFH